MSFLNFRVLKMDPVAPMTGWKIVLDTPEPWLVVAGKPVGAECLFALSHGLALPLRLCKQGPMAGPAVRMLVYASARHGALLL